MYILPAIDLRAGQVVRLYQGDYDQMTVYGQDPAAQALAFRQAGASQLHLVDLDGAKDGTTANYESIRSITALGGFSIEVGGGIRTQQRIEDYLTLGVERCILGTVAVEDFDFTARMAKEYGSHIAVGVDARDGYVAIKGWKELSGEKGIDFCRRLAGGGQYRYLHRHQPGRRHGRNQSGALSPAHCHPGAQHHCQRGNQL